MESNLKRDEFPLDVKEIMKQRAAYICSNPACKKMTIAPSVEDENKVQYIGVCAHITAAKIGGPRYDENLLPEQRANISNGIFLCSNCATLIDKNKGLDYKTSELRSWKEQHEKWVLQNLNKSSENLTALFTAASNNQMGGITANVVNVQGFTTEKPDTSKIHDIELFKKAEEIFNDNVLIKILASLTGDESIRANDIDKIEHLKFFYQKASNQYINNDIETAKKLFLTELTNLNIFIATEFDMWPYDQRGDNYKACLDPKNSMDRAGNSASIDYQRHNELQNKLLKIIDAFQKSYDLLRREIKTALHV